MNILAVDDEILQLDKMKDSLQLAFPDADIYAVQKPSEAMQLSHKVGFDFAFLDIQMRMMTGIELAAVLKTSTPAMRVVFVTAFDEYRKLADDTAPLAFILKPINPQKIFNAVQNSGRNDRTKSVSSSGPMLSVTTAGQFQVFDRNAQPLRFQRSKARELLAYLIFRRGEFCTEEELIATVIGKEKIGTDNEKIFREILSDMMQTLQRSAAEGAVLRRRNELAIDPDRITCDFYGNQNKSGFWNGFVKKRCIPEYDWSARRN